MEELNVERAPLLPSFVMEESDTVEVSCFYNSLSFSPCHDVIYHLSYHDDASESLRDRHNSFFSLAKDGCFD